MAASVILNVIIGEEGVSMLARTARKWAVPAQAPSDKGDGGKRQRLSEYVRRWRTESSLDAKGGFAIQVFTRTAVRLRGARS